MNDYFSNVYKLLIADEIVQAKNKSNRNRDRTGTENRTKPETKNGNRNRNKGNWVKRRQFIEKNYCYCSS